MIYEAKEVTPPTMFANVSAPARLSLALLGSARIHLDGAPVSFDYEKVRALLVFLAVESGRAHRRVALAELLWPDQGEATARHSLSQALYRLRRALRDDDATMPLMLATRDSVRFNPEASVWLDVATFGALLREGADVGQLQQAAALHRGEFLEDCSIDESAAFEEWALLTREHLRRQACDALRRLADAGAGSINTAQAVGYARQWLALDPLCEEAHRHLMRALAEGGQRTAALAAFAHCQRMLHDELGIAPEPATLALYEELKRNEVPVLAPAMPVSMRLPPPPTRLLGRERELAELQSLLADAASQLLTITGPGGVGKTCLALHVATACAPAFRDGVCFVPLAPVREPGLVLPAIAQALSVPLNDARPLDERVCAALAGRHLLLLLDNCEHLLPAVATVTAALLAGAPTVTALATSRAPLRLSHERRYQLAPLGLPADDELAQASRAPAGSVALFIERAQAARPAVELDYAAIGAICRRLDGLPLAIELAAAHMRLVNPRELLARMEQRLPLLGGGSRDLPERQQTLDATIDWSYQLLAPKEQALFRRLAVFTGGWSVEAAEAVCSDEAGVASQLGSVLAGLAELLDANLISQATGAVEPRCTILETVREFAAAQLVAQGELAHVQLLHAGYFGKVAAQAASELSSVNQAEWLRRLDAELDNIRAALRWCVANAVGVGLRLASDLSRYWDIRGYWREGRGWLEALLQQPLANAAIEERAAGLMVAGSLSTFLHDFAPATNYLYEGLALYRQLGDQQAVGRVLNNLGNVAQFQGDYREAEQHYRQSLLLRRALNHRVGMAASLYNLGVTARMRGDLQAAKAHFDQSRALYLQLGDSVAAASILSQVATLLLLQGAYSDAQQLFATSHATAQELGDAPGRQQALSGRGDVARMQRRYGEAANYYRQSLALAAEICDVGAAARDLFRFAVIAWAEGRGERAAVLLSATDALYRSAHIAQPPEDTAQFEQRLAEVRDALGHTLFEAAWARGQAAPLEQAVALALDTPLADRVLQSPTFEFTALARTRPPRNHRLDNSGS